MDDILAFSARGAGANRHAGVLVNDFEGKLSSVVNFLRPGLDAQGDCVLVVSGPAFKTWKAALASRDIECDGEPGAVTFIAGADWLPPRGVNSIRMASRLYERIEESRVAGRELFIAIDMDWVVETRAPVDKVCHWEATCDHLLAPEPDVSVLCLYDVTELPVRLLHAGFRTHNFLTVNGHTLANPYFEAPAILTHEPDLNECSDDPEVVESMLRHFQDVA